MSELAEMLRERTWCDLGVVKTLPVPSPTAPTGSRKVLVKLTGSDRVVDARVLNLGQGAGKGVFAPLQVGDEVLVLLPSGDPMRAVCLGGLGGAIAPNPLENTGLRALIQHPGGVLLATTDGQPAHGIVHGQHLVDMAPWVAALEAFMVAISTATTAPQVAAAAVTFMTAVGLVASPPGSTFGAALLTSAGAGTPPGAGGPPHATSLHKVTP